MLAVNDIVIDVGRVLQSKICLFLEIKLTICDKCMPVHVVSTVRSVV